MIENDDLMKIDTQSSEGLSDAQEKVLAILPIPSAILSILGSATILYMSLKTRKERKWTPYTRLLIGMSVSDIISSVTLGVAAFLRPRENQRVWMFGNDATCSAIGFLTQFSYSGLFYNAMLSFYFLLSARFHLTNEYIARKFEPFMHFLSLMFPLVTAIVGAGMGVYSTTTFELGCSVNDYPRGCIGEECISVTISWYYFGLPFLLSLLSIVTSNVIILIYVRRQTRPLRKKQQDITALAQSTDQIESEEAIGDDATAIVASMPAYHEPDSAILNSLAGRSSRTLDIKSSRKLGIPTSPATRHCKTSKTKEEGSARTSSFRLSTGQSWRMRRRNTKPQKSSVERDQVRRLWLVSSQALLFVASYLLTAGWLGLLRIIESMAETLEEELEMVSKIYPLMILNAFFSPLQGLFNMMVFLRPKYLKWRHEYPEESRFWVTKRAIFGKGVKPTKRRKTASPSQNHLSETMPAASNHDQDDHIEINEEKNVTSCKEKNIEDKETGSDPATTRLPYSMVSSLTVSLGAFDHVTLDDKDDERWHGCHNSPEFLSPMQVQPRMTCSLNSSAISGLQVISELSESIFEPVAKQQEDDVDSKITPINPQRIPPHIMLRPEASESRWSPFSRSPRLELRMLSMTGEMSIPQRLASEDATSVVDIPNESIVLSSASSRSSGVMLAFEDDYSSSNADTPIRVPMRRLSPPPSDVLDPSATSVVDIPNESRSSGVMLAFEDDDYSSSSADTPIRVPMRRLSPPPSNVPDLQF